MDKPMQDKVEEEIESSIDEDGIEAAAKAVGDLIPEDFKSMPGLDVPVEAEDGEEVKVVLIGTAKDGKLTQISGAECKYGDEEEGEEKSTGRIKVMIMAGKNEEE